jgi:hypothetical protein
LKYSNKSKNNKTGSTAKVEECVPKTRPLNKIPPLPVQPVAYPLQGSSQPLYSDTSKPSNPSLPLCEDRTYSCPPDCPPNFTQKGHVPGAPDCKDPEFKYWKHMIAALVLAGVSTIAVNISSLYNNYSI